MPTASLAPGFIRRGIRTLETAHRQIVEHGVNVQRLPLHIDAPDRDRERQSDARPQAALAKTGSAEPQMCQESLAKVVTQNVNHAL